MSLENDGIGEAPPEEKPANLQRVNLAIRKNLAHFIQSWRFGWILLALVGLGLLLAIVDILVRLFVYKVRLGTISEVVGRFITSPGAAGLAALAAAIIGAVMISKQLKLARATAHESEWWDKFEWVTERALPSVQDHVRIPDNVSLNFLNQLQGSAQSAIQQEACGGFVDHLAVLGREEPEQAEPSLATTEDAPEPAKSEPSVIHSLDLVDRTKRAWSQYVENTRNTPARSITAEWIVRQAVRDEYETQVFRTLSKIDGVTDLDQLKGSPDTGSDGHLRYRGIDVFVVIRHSLLSGKGLNGLEENAKFDLNLSRSIAKMHQDSDRVIIISNTTPRSRISSLEGKRVEIVGWLPGTESDAISDALHRLTS